MVTRFTGNAATKRPRAIQRIVDASIARLMKLPATTGSYTVNEDLPVPMRDGTLLLADHYAPTGPALGTVLVRSPYGRNQLMTAVYARPYAARGYHVVLVRCRGTFGSGGAWEPMQHEIADGADTVEWLREQPWFGGHFVSLGASYLGFTQWALLMDPPAELAAAIIQVGPHDFAEAAHAGGAFTLTDMLGWGEVVAHQEEFGLLRGAMRLMSTGKRIAPALQRLPISQAGDGLLGDDGDWFARWVRTRDLDDPFWAAMRLGAALDRVQVPVLLHSGWQDIFLRQTVQQFTHLKERGIDVAMTIGPWQHLDIEGPATPRLMAESLDWMAEHLAGARRVRPTPVRVLVTGVDEWRDLPTWPPASVGNVLHPTAAGSLDAAPETGAASASFVYDPVNPTPTVGGRVMFIGGRTDDSAWSQRSDVLSWTGPALTSALDVIGEASVDLDHSTDNPHCDLFVRLSDVAPDGKSINVADGFLRLDPLRSLGAVHLTLDPVAHRFATGHRVRLSVAGGSHPRWDRNLGTGADAADSSQTQPSRHTIGLAGSRLVLPVTT